MAITMEMVIDTMDLAKFADENGFHDMVLTGHPENREKYHSIFKPEIEKFKKKYGKTPNILLNDFLKDYIQTRGLGSEYTSDEFHFVGLKVHGYTWGCIHTKNTEGLSQTNPVAMQLPQLYLTFFPDVIRFGFAFGNLVKDDNSHVTVFRELPDHEKVLDGLIKKDPELAFEDDSTWSANIRIIKTYPKEGIDDTLEQKIRETFDNLLEVFKITSLPYEGTNSPPLFHLPETKHWQISLRGDVSKWDEWKKNNIIAIGFKEVFQSAGEKILEMSGDEIKKLFGDAYPENPNPEKETDNIINFLQKMKEGHYVLIDNGESDLGWGIIKSDPIYGYSQEFPVYRQIEWKNTAMQEPVTEGN